MPVKIKKGPKKVKKPSGPPTLTEQLVEALPSQASKKIKEQVAAPKKSPEKGPGSFKRINELGEEKVSMLNSLFLEGKSVPQIMTTLQEGWGAFTDVSQNTLQKYLYRYKWEVIDKGLAISTVLDAGARAGDKRLVLVKEALDDLNVLTEMHELVVVQKARVKKILTRENDMPVLFNSVGGEMKTLAGFLQQFSDLAFDLGVMKRVPQISKITKDGHTTTVESEGKNHVALSIAASAQVEEAAKQFFSVLEEAEHGGKSVH